ncbi:MAG: molybdopterin molybdotransferase MoeA [Gammaproteobacteria bacterium]
MIISQSSCNDINESGLITVNEALANILSGVPVVSGYECLNIEHCCGRTLAEAVHATLDVPPRTNSAVDGYALRSADLPERGTATLAIAGSAHAGQPFHGKAPPGHCVRIMTGAPMPEGLDTVIVQEQVEVAKDAIRIDARHEAGQNVREAGEDLKEGQTVLSPGRWLTPPDIGLIASLGIAEINVRRKLAVAVASTGNEIHGIGSTPGEGGIYDSNRYSLMAALSRPGIDLVNLGIVEDSPEALQDCFQRTARFADVIIATGGVSVGEADYTKAALESSGSIDFWKVAIKPGRPLAFGRIGDAVFFGLPGNPVAAMVTFYLFVLPALNKMQGITDKPAAPSFHAQTTENIRKKPGRTEVPRGIIEQRADGQWTVKTTGEQGSGILSSMSRANAFILLEHERDTVKAGEWVTVLPFAGLF